MRCLPFVLLVLCLSAPTYADELGAARTDFRKALKSDKWTDRQDAYVILAGYDGKEAAQEALSALVKEKNAAVVYSGVKALSGMKSAGAQVVYAETLRKGKTAAKLLVLMALDSTTQDLNEVLHEVLVGKDASAVAHAAMALGRRQSIASVPNLLPLLKHKVWQVRRGAAVALLALANPPAPPPAPGTKEIPVAPPPPDALKGPDVVTALIDALEAGSGAERSPMLQALARITGADFGLDIAAWKQLASGKAVDAIKRHPVAVPHVFGIPILGRRVVVVFDRSMRMDNATPFRELARKKELCLVPGGRSIPYMKLHRARNFAGAHVKRMFADMDKDQRIEVVLFHSTVDRVFGKFSAPTSGAKKALKELFKDLQVNEGINAYDALTLGLDIAGKKDAKAWKSGPDELIFVTVNIPTAGEIVDPDALAPAIALKARLRMVPIHTIGINTHAYEMLRTIAHQTGGVYRDYHK